MYWVFGFILAIPLLSLFVGRYYSIYQRNYYRKEFQKLNSKLKKTILTQEEEIIHFYENDDEVRFEIAQNERFYKYSDFQGQKFTLVPTPENLNLREKSVVLEILPVGTKIIFDGSSLWYEI